MGQGTTNPTEFDTSDASENKWRNERRSFLVLLATLLLVAIVATAVGVTSAVGEKGLGANEVATAFTLLVFFFAATFAVYSIGLMHSKLPGARRIRTTADGIELGYGTRTRADVWRWGDERATFSLEDYSLNRGAEFYKYHHLVSAGHFYSVRSFVPEVVFIEILKAAEQNAKEVREISQTFWAMGIRKKWIIKCG